MGNIDRIERLERRDPYYPKPAQDPLWPAFEEAYWSVTHRRPTGLWNWMEQEKEWWHYWQMFLAGHLTREHKDKGPAP